MSGQQGRPVTCQLDLPLTLQVYSGHVVSLWYRPLEVLLGQEGGNAKSRCGRMCWPMQVVHGRSTARRNMGQALIFGLLLAYLGRWRWVALYFAAPATLGYAISGGRLHYFHSLLEACAAEEIHQIFAICNVLGTPGEQVGLSCAVEKLSAAGRHSSITDRICQVFPGVSALPHFSQNFPQWRNTDFAKVRARAGPRRGGGR